MSFQPNLSSDNSIKLEKKFKLRICPLQQTLCMGIIITLSFKISHIHRLVLRNKTQNVLYCDIIYSVVIVETATKSMKK